jgi:uncharacterized protein (DUF362 family)
MHMRRAASQRVSRRRFLGISAAGVAAGAAGLGVRQGASAQDDGDVRVARVRCESAVVDGFPEVSACRAMLERAAQLLRGQTLPDLLASLVAPDDVVGIKVNTLAGFELATNLEVVDALIEGLLEAGVPASNIVVWDRFEHHLISCLYEIQRSEGGVRCYGGESDGAVGLDPDVFYASELGDGEPSYLYRVATQDVTKIINVPVPKDHNCSGVTGCLKNIAFGAVNNTVRFHGAPHYCDPMIGEICALPALRDKVVLHVMDALRALCDGGPTVGNPERIFEPRELWLATDPVAADTVALDMINAEREASGLPPIGEAGPSPKHIETAEALGLGVSAPGASSIAYADISSEV